MELDNVHNVHMIGIGGIGMSALARFMNLRGKSVTGYDRTSTPLTQQLTEEGIGVEYEANPKRLASIDLVIYTPAVPATHEELVKAKEMGLPIMKRAEVLGMISRAYRTIAIAGTHGKTTTTSLVTHLLKSAGIDVTAFIGGISRNFNTNFVFGESEWLVVEADEFDRSFLHLHPEIAVITSMDPDHLDIYGTGDELKASFHAFANQIKPGGTLFICEGLAKPEPENVMAHTYGVEKGDLQATNLHTNEQGVAFSFKDLKGEQTPFELNVPGRYNLENACAALGIASLLNLDKAELRKGLKSSKGVNRRFEYRLKTEKAIVIDDYAHHPEEIKAVLNAVRGQFGESRKLIAVFQPHLYSRTNDFHKGFAEALSLADEVLLLDIYPAREKPMPGVSSDMIFDLLKVNKKARCGRDEAVSALQPFKDTPALVMTIGAGDIDTQVQPIVEEVKTW